MLSAEKKEGVRSRVGSFFNSKRLAAPVAVLDQALVSGVNFLTAQLLFAFGSKEIGGAYALAWIVVLFTRSTVINLVATPYTVRHGRGESTFSVYAASSFVQQLTIAFIASLIMGIVGAIFFWKSPDAPLGESLGYTFFAAALVAPFLMAREYARQISFAHCAPWAALVMDFVAGVAQLAILYAAISMLVGAPIAFLASGIGSLLGFGVWWAFGLQRLSLHSPSFRRDWSENWQFGRWALVSQITGNLAPLPWIIFAMWGAGETGAFDGANRIVGLSNILVMGYSNFLAAAAARAFTADGASALWRISLRAVFIFTFGLGGLCLMTLVWGGDLLSLVMRGKIENAGGIVAVLALATLIDGLSQVAIHSLRAMHRPADAMIADLFEVAATLIIGLPLIWQFSAPGAAWAMVFGRFVGLLLRWRIYLWRLHHLPVASPKIASSR